MADLIDFQNYGTTPTPSPVTPPQAQQGKGFLTPAQVEAYNHQLASFGLGERNKQLEEQIAQARALMGNHSDNNGSFMGALAHGLSGIRARQQIEDAQGEQRQNLESERASYADNLRNAMAKGGNDPQALGQAGMMMSSTGAPSLDVAGKAFGQQAAFGQQGQRLLQEYQERQQQRDTEAKRQAALEKYQQGELDYRNKALQQGKYSMYRNPATGELFKINSATGEEVPVSTGAPIIPKGGGKGGASQPVFYGEDFEPIHPEAPPQLDKKEAGDLRKRYAANVKLQDMLKQYEDTLNSSGHLDRIAGPIAQKLTTLQGQIKPTWVESNGFSRFTENENHLLDTILPKSAGRDVYRLDPAVIAAIHQIRNGATSDIQSNLHARGLKLKGSSVPPGGIVAGPNHDAAADWLAKPENQSKPNYAAVKAAYDKAHGQ